MSSTTARRGVGIGAGGGHFPVGRRRHVPVVDTGCSCRPRRPRVQLSLPSFLKPSFSSKPAAGAKPARSNSSSSFFQSSSSTASFSTSYASSNCSNYYSYHGFGAAPKQQQPQEIHLPTAAKQVPVVTPASPVRRQPASAKKKQKKRYNYVEKRAATAAEAEQEDVGLAVEKDSSDPRADFRESMVQMVVETGLCSWDDLRCMLRRLLALNSPRHHAAILTAFAELCAQLASPPPPAPAASSYHYQF